MQLGSATSCATALMLTTMTVQRLEPRASTTCGTNIVSATVMATYCSHAVEAGDELDLMILWRGRPGWFQRRGSGTMGESGMRTNSPGRGGQVSESRSYENVTISYAADFDARTVTLGDVPDAIPLEQVNAVLIDGVDRPEGGRVIEKTRVASRVTVGGDPNVTVIGGSETLLRFLQCGIAMPQPPMPQPPVVTVCDRLSKKR